MRRLAWWAADYVYAVRRQARALWDRSGPRDFLNGSESPVVVIPGVYEPWRFMLPLIRRLHRDGHPVHVLDPLRNNRVPVVEGARIVDEYLAAAGLADVVLLAHSKGGLIGKHVMAFGRHADRVRSMVAVAAPFGGSRYARYLLGRTLRAFSPVDPTIVLLAEAPEVNARIVSVYARFDPHIPEGSELAGARNVPVDTGGHFRVLDNVKTIAVVREVADHGVERETGAVSADDVGERMKSSADRSGGEEGLSAPTGQEEVLRAIPRPDGEMPRVLVLGATGYLGGRLMPRLLNAGYRVRTLSRSEERIRAYPWSEETEIEVGDAGDAEAMARAVRDVDIIVYLVHSMSSGAEFAEKDREIAENVAARAREAGVSRIVYLGGLHPEGVRLSPHLASRTEVGEILLASGVPTLELQAGVVIGSGSASFEMVRHLTEVLPYMPAPKWVRNFIQPIAVRDVLHYLLAAARVEHEVNRALDIGGPDVLRYGQMMNGYAVEAGLPQRGIASLPVLTPRLASHWVGLVTPVPTSIARPLVESLQHRCVMQNHDVDAILPQPEHGLTPYREAVRLALGRIEVDGVETSWVDARVAAPSEPLPSDPEWAGRTVFTDQRERESTASPDAVWSVITQIGGETGWYSSPRLWALRGWYDRITGGVGLQRGRRSRTRLVVGDAVDVWRVESIEPGRLLRLRAEMRVPGLAWLELSVEPTGRGSVYRQRAVFFPRGLTGRLYWLAMLPFHGLIFSGMVARIVGLAEEERSRGADS